MYACSEIFCDWIKLADGPLCLAGTCLLCSYSQNPFLLRENGGEKDSPPSSLHWISVSIKCKIFLDVFHWTPICPMYRKSQTKRKSCFQTKKKHKNETNRSKFEMGWLYLHTNSVEKLVLGSQAQSSPRAAWQKPPGSRLFVSTNPYPLPFFSLSERQPPVGFFPRR